MKKTSFEYEKMEFFPLINIAAVPQIVTNVKQLHDHREMEGICIRRFSLCL